MSHPFDNGIELGQLALILLVITLAQLWRFSMNCRIEIAAIGINFGKGEKQDN